MRSYLLLASCLFTVICASAQEQPRKVGYRIIGKDSVNLVFNDKYQMIEDSCATITRYGHFDPRQRIFNGHFKDVSRQAPDKILAEGNYTADGSKNGEFIAHYLNGNLRAKGHFKDNKYDGKWELYYDNGKPQMNFEAADGQIRIMDVWDEKGGHAIDNGKGKYKVNAGGVVWSGKLENGLPDGLWKAVRADDPTETLFVKELFNKNKFEKGQNAVMSYQDASRIVLIDPAVLPFIQAEKMDISPVACGGTDFNTARMVNAKYREGNNGFSQEISRLINPYIQSVNIAPYNDQLVVEGLVGRSGSVYSLRATTSFNEDIARGVIRQLNRLPVMYPATLDGQPVEEKIIITFNFRLGVYSFSWRLQPIAPKKN